MNKNYRIILRKEVLAILLNSVNANYKNKQNHLTPKATLAHPK
jgi:hypothetical protein